MAGTVRVKLVAEDQASAVVKKFASSALASLNKVSQASLQNVSTMTRSMQGVANATQKAATTLSQGLVNAANATTKAVANAGVTINKTSTATTNWTSKILGLTKAALGISSAVVAFNKIKDAIGSAFGEAVKFETSMAKVQTLGASLGASYQQVMDDIRAIGPLLGNQTDLVEGLFTAVTTGATDYKRAMDLVKSSAMVARAQFVEQNDVIKLGQQVLFLYGDEIGSVHEAMNKLVKVTTVGNVVFSELKQPLGQALSAAKTAGVAYDELATAIGTLAQPMGSAANAGTALNNMMIQMIKRADAFMEYGIDIQAILAERGPGGGLVGALRAVEKATGGNIDKLLELVPNLRAFRGAAALMGDGLNRLEHNLARVRDGSDELRRNFELTTKTTQGAWDTMKNSAKDSVVGILNDSTDLQNVLIDLANGFIYVKNNSASFGKALTLVILAAQSAAAVFGVLLSSVTSTAKVIGGVWTGIAEFGNKAISYLSGKVLELDKNYNLLNDTGKKVMTGINESTTEAGKIAEGWSAKVAGMGQAADGFTKGAAEGMIRSFNSLIQPIEETGQKTEYLSNVTREEVDEMRKRRDAEAAAAHATTQNAQATTNSAKATTGATTALRTYVKDGITYYTNRTEEAIKASDKQAESIKKSIKPMENVAKASENMGKTIKVSFEESQKKFYDMEGHVKRLPTTVGKPIDTTGTVFKGGTHKMGEGADEVAKKLQSLAKDSKGFLVIVGKQVKQTSDEVEKAFEKLFNTTPEKAKNMADQTSGHLATLSRSGQANAAALVTAYHEAHDNLSNTFGPDSRIVKNFELQNKAMLDKALRTKEGLVAHFESIGIALELPIKGGVEAAIKGFEMLKNRSDVSRDYLKQKAQETADFVISQGGKWPQAWTSAYDVVINKGKSTQDEVSKNFREIGLEGENSASKVKNSFEKAADAQGSIADRFKGTWIDNLEQIAIKAEETGRRMKVGIDTSSGTHTDAEGNEITETGRISLEDTRVSQDVQALLKDLKELNEAMRSTTGGSPQAASARRLYTQEIAKVKNRLRELGFNEAGNPINQPTTPSGGGTTTGGGGTRLGLAGGEDPLKSLRDELARLQRLNTARPSNIEYGRGEFAGTADVTVDNAEITVSTTTGRAIASTPGATTDQMRKAEQILRDHRMWQAGIAGQIANLQQEIQEKMGTPGIATLPAYAGAGSVTGNDPTTNSNTEATTQNTDAINNLNNTLGGESGGVKVEGISTGSFGVPSLGDRDFSTLYPGGGFANGGTVAQTGTYQLEKGEEVVPRLGTRFENGVNFLGRGDTTVSKGPQGVANFQRSVEMAEKVYANTLYSQGRAEDILGHRGQSQIAAAIVQPTKQMIRRRDLMADLTRNSPLTQQGAATTK